MCVLEANGMYHHAEGIRNDQDIANCINTLKEKWIAADAKYFFLQQHPEGNRNYQLIANSSSIFKEIHTLIQKKNR